MIWRGHREWPYRGQMLAMAGWGVRKVLVEVRQRAGAIRPFPPSPLTLAEEGCPEAHDRGALLDGDLEISAHAHA